MQRERGTRDDAGEGAIKATTDAALARDGLKIQGGQTKACLCHQDAPLPLPLRRAPHEKDGRPTVDRDIGSAAELLLLVRSLSAGLRFAPLPPESGESGR